MIRESTHKEDITITYTPIIRASKCINQMLADLKGETDFSFTHSEMEKSSKQKIKKETLALNHT